MKRKLEKLWTFKLSSYVWVRGTDVVVRLPPIAPFSVVIRYICLLYYFVNKVIFIDFDK